MSKEKTPKGIITVCGSTKFKLEYEYVIKKLIELGFFVHSVEVYGHADNLPISKAYKEWLQDIHFWKINRSHAIYVVDVGEYLGKSTREEILHAQVKQKPIYWYSKGDLLDG